MAGSQRGRHVILVSIMSCLGAYILFATICAICSIIQEKINMLYQYYGGGGVDIKNGQKMDKNSNERDAAIDPEDRRRQMALAAEKRVQNFKTRGMKNRQSKVVKI